MADEDDVQVAGAVNAQGEEVLPDILSEEMLARIRWELANDTLRPSDLPHISTHRRDAYVDASPCSEWLCLCPGAYGPWSTCIGVAPSRERASRHVARCCLTLVGTNGPRSA